MKNQKYALGIEVSVLFIIYAVATSTKYISDYAYDFSMAALPAVMGSVALAFVLAVFSSENADE